MNANRIISMVIRMVVNRLIRTGVNAGVNKMSKAKQYGPDETKGQAPQSADTQKRMRQSMRVMRKIGRF